MSGRYMKLNAGRYVLSVPQGRGPAGVHRAEGADIAVDRHGGEISFDVRAEERVYFWWRGAAVPAGLRVMGPGPASRTRPRARRQDRADTATGLAERGTQLAP